MKTWTVYVGGIEVNDYLMLQGDALLLANQYRVAGYEDVCAIQITRN